MPADDAVAAAATRIMLKPHSSISDTRCRSQWQTPDRQL